MGLGCGILINETIEKYCKYWVFQWYSLFMKKIKSIANLFKEVISLLIAGCILLLWLTQALLALDAQNRGGQYGTLLSGFILIRLSVVAVALSIFIFITNLSKEKIAFTKSNYYSGIILLLSLAWGSWSLYWNIQLSKMRGDINGFPGILIVKLFNKIPGFFPLNNVGYAGYFIKDFALTFSTIVLIYIVLISIKIAFMRLFAFVDKKLNKETFTHE
jgi:hypothetical protein